MYSLGDKLKLNDRNGQVMFEGAVTEVKEDWIMLTSGGKNEPKLSQCCKPSEFQGTIEKI